MTQQVSVDPDSIVRDLQNNDTTTEVLPDVAYKRLALVNVVFYGSPHAGDRNWVLIDSGIPGSAGFIRKAATQRFGEDARPAAIIQTHGHFDHIGHWKR